MDSTALAGIIIGVVASLALALTDLKRVGPFSRLLLWALIIDGVLFSVAVLIFRGVGIMRIPFWPSVVVGALIGGVLVAAAWKHVQTLEPTTPAEAQAPAKPPAPPKPPAAGSTTPGPTITSPGGMNIFGGTVNNPTIHNYATPRPWELSAQQSALLARRVTPHAGGRTDKHDLITAVLGDPDSARFALSLVSAFREAKWGGVGGSGYSQAIFSGNVEGIIVKIHSREATPRGLWELVTTLREAGIESVGEIDPSVPLDDFRIIVGRKPQ